MAKTAIITGGSRGLGAAMAKKLGEMGFNVVLAYHSASSEKLTEEVAAEIEKFGVETLIVRADVSKFEERVIATNLMSFMHMTHLVLPYMISHSSKDDQCNIVNISSVGGLTGVINQADYCASKAGVIGMSRALALEYAGKGIRVNCIAPGMIMTDMLRGVNQDELNALAATIPEGYIGGVHDIADAMEYLLKANYVTGQVLSPNGGFVMQ